MIGERRWVAVTRDARIRYRPNELAAVMTHRVALLVIVGRGRHAELAHNFVATAARIERFFTRHTPPLIAKVHRPSPSDRARKLRAQGTISLWQPRS